MIRVRSGVVALLLVCALAACRREHAPALDPQAPVSAALSAESIRVGDVVELQLAVRHAAGTRVELPALGDGRRVVVRDLKADPESPGAADGRSVWHAKLTSFEVGTHGLTTGSVRFVAADGSVSEQPFPSVALRVESILDATNASVRPLKPLAGWRRGLPAWFWTVVLATLGVAVLAGLLARAWARRGQPQPAAPPPPPHEVALRELAELRRRGWMEAGEVEPFYVELSRIVRAYLEHRFHLHAPEQTTEEFIRETSTSRVLSAPHQLLVQAFLEQSDLVKFARHVPGVADMQAALEAAERLIRETIPHPPAPHPQPPSPVS